MVLIGIAGLVLPIIPGWLLIGAGLAVLRAEFASPDRRAVRSQPSAPEHQTGSDHLAA